MSVIVLTLLSFFGQRAWRMGGDDEHGDRVIVRVSESP